MSELALCANGYSFEEAVESIATAAHSEFIKGCHLHRLQVPFDKQGSMHTAIRRSPKRWQERLLRVALETMRLERTPEQGQQHT